MARIDNIKGGALLTALFIMTLVAIVATAMTTRLQLDIYRTRLIVIHDKLYMASQAVTFWAFNELANQKNQYSKALEQGNVAQFPTKMAGIYPQMQITGTLYDLQARYNLNNLTDKKSIRGYINLESNALGKVQETQSKNSALAIIDWLSNYDMGKGKDSYTTYYLKQKPAYQTSHQMMQSYSEFRLIQDIGADKFLALEPFVTVLPENTAININTASRQVLMSLGNGLKESRVNELIQAREQNGIKDLKKLAELLKKLDISSEQITIESSYFLTQAQVKSEDYSMTVYSLFKRSKDKNKKLTVQLVRQSINGF